MDGMRFGKRELSDDGWGGFEAYMKKKAAKLANQFQKDSIKTGTSSSIFKGISIYVNGYTDPPAEKLKRLMMMHGGRYIYYPTKANTTHIIATNLAYTKIKELKNDKVVTPSWITDSVEAGKLLPIATYLLYRPKASNQTLHRYAQKKPSKESRIAEEMEIQEQEVVKNSSLKEKFIMEDTIPDKSTTVSGEDKLIVSRSRIDDRNEDLDSESVTNMENSICLERKPRTDQLDDYSNLEMEYIDKEGGDKGFQDALNRGNVFSRRRIKKNSFKNSIKDQVYIEKLDSTDAETGSSLKDYGSNFSKRGDREEENGVNRQGKSRALYEDTLLCPKETTDKREPDKSQKQSSESISFDKGLFSDPKNGKCYFPKPTDPNFLPTFYRHSSFYHLTTWRAEHKIFVKELQRRCDGTFPGKQKLMKMYDLKKKQISAKFEDNVVGGDLKEEVGRRENRQTDDIVLIPGEPEKKNNRVIMHIDMDAFFVAVSLLNYPELRGKPVAVAHYAGKLTTKPSTEDKGQLNQMKTIQSQPTVKDWKWGLNERIASKGEKLKDPAGDEESKHRWQTTKDRPMQPSQNMKASEFDNFTSLAAIASCSYEAGWNGVRNGMIMKLAKELCPELRTIQYDFDGYHRVSRQLYEIVASYTHDIQAASCDEVIIDVTNLIQETGASGAEIANVIREDIYQKTKCTASAGLASNVILARLCTKAAKPDGVYSLKDEDIGDFLRNSPVGDLPGIGRAFNKKMHDIGVYTCFDLQRLTLKNIQKQFGPKIGQILYQNCRGYDTRPMKSEKQRKYVSVEVNYGIRFDGDDDAYMFIHRLSGEVRRKLQRLEMAGQTVTLKLKVRRAGTPVEDPKFMGYGVYDNKIRSSTLSQETADWETIHRACKGLLMQLAVAAKDIRGVGIQMSRLKQGSSVKSMSKPLTELLPKKGDILNHDSQTTPGPKRPYSLLPFVSTGDKLNNPTKTRKESINNHRDRSDSDALSPNVHVGNTCRQKRRAEEAAVNILEAEGIEEIEEEDSPSRLEVGSHRRLPVSRSDGFCKGKELDDVGMSHGLGGSSERVRRGNPKRIKVDNLVIPFDEDTARSADGPESSSTSELNRNGLNLFSVSKTESTSEDSTMDVRKRQARPRKEKKLPLTFYKAGSSHNERDTGTSPELYRKTHRYVTDLKSKDNRHIDEEATDGDRKFSTPGVGMPECHSFSPKEPKIDLSVLELLPGEIRSQVIEDYMLDFKPTDTAITSKRFDPDEASTSSGITSELDQDVLQGLPSDILGEVLAGERKRLNLPDDENQTSSIINVIHRKQKRNTKSKSKEKLTRSQPIAKRTFHDVIEGNADNTRAEELIENIGEKGAKRRAIDNASNQNVQIKLNMHALMSREKSTNQAKHDSKDDTHEQMNIHEAVPMRIHGTDVSEKTVFSDSVRDVGIKKDEGMRASQTIEKSENKTSLGGATTCAGVKEKLREWMQTFESPLEEDICHVVHFLRSHILDQNLQMVHQLLRAFKRMVSANGNKDWKDTDVIITEKIQTTMGHLYGSALNLDSE